MLLKGSENFMLKHGILGLLNYGSMTGYDIMLTFRNSLNYLWNAQTSQIYRELQTLKKNGWVSDMSIHQEGKPDKNLFSITESGKNELKRWLTEDDTEFRMRNPLMMKIFFRGELGIEENIEYFKKLLNQCDDFMKLIEKSPFDVDMYEGMIENPEKALYWKMTVEFGFMYSQIYREWLEKCIKEMEELINENTAD